MKQITEYISEHKILVAHKKFNYLHKLHKSSATKQNKINKKN